MLRSQEYSNCHEPLYPNKWEIPNLKTIRYLKPSMEVAPLITGSDRIQSQHPILQVGIKAPAKSLARSYKT